MFLRGNGGKSATLGQQQNSAVHVSATDGISITLNNMSFATGQTTLTDYNSSVVPVVKSYQNWYGYASEIMFAGGSYSVPLTINSAAGETRPVNKSVRYMIRALP